MKKQATMRDIAEAANVSLSTVHRVLNDSGYVAETKRAKILSAAAELGYELPKFPFPGSSCSLIAVITASYGAFTPIDSAALVDVLLIQHARRHKLDIYFHQAPERILEPDYLIQAIENVLRYHPIGIIIHGTLEAASTPALEAFLDTLSLPIVNLGQSHPSYRFCRISIDNVRGMYIATKYLLDQGRRHLLYFGSNIIPTLNKERKQGFLAAIEECPDASVCHYIYHSPDEDPLPDWYGSYEVMKDAFAEHPDIDAIVNWYEGAIPGEIRFLKETGRDIPGDVTIMSFGDILTPCLYPPLPGCKTPLEENVESALQHILNSVAGTDSVSASEIRIMPTLKTR